MEWMNEAIPAGSYLRFKETEVKADTDLGAAALCHSLFPPSYVSAPASFYSLCH